MSKKAYILKIASEEILKLSNILNQNSTNDLNSGYWEYEILEEDNVDCLQILMDFYKNSVGVLGEIEDVDTSIWILYEYDQQCNLEFDIHQMRQMSDLNIHLCISCWERW